LSKKSWGMSKSGSNLTLPVTHDRTLTRLHRDLCM